MIIFEEIKWKNFLSTGNHWTEIDFQKHQTNMVIGKNGAGKSTMLDALTFVLFNKPFRKINKGQLVNTSNERDCLVEINKFYIQIVITGISSDEAIIPLKRWYKKHHSLAKY